MTGWTLLTTMWAHRWVKHSFRVVGLWLSFLFPFIHGIPEETFKAKSLFDYKMYVSLILDEIQWEKPHEDLLRIMFLGFFLGQAQPTAAILTSVVDDLGAQDSGHLQHSDEGLVHGGEREGRHAVPPGHLGDVHCTVTWKRHISNTFMHVTAVRSDLCHTHGACFIFPDFFFVPQEILPFQNAKLLICYTCYNILPI